MQKLWTHDFRNHELKFDQLWNNLLHKIIPKAEMQFIFYILEFIKDKTCNMDKADE